MSATNKHLPPWREAKLGEILPLKYGKARSELYGYPNPETPTFGSNGAIGTYARALTQGPSILVGRKGAAGVVHFSAEPCWPIDTTYYTEGNDGIFLPFFRYLLDGLRLSQFDRSTAIPSLSRDDYDSRIIRFPDELDEQRQVVAEIEKQFTRLGAGVSALRRVQANLKRYRAAVLKAACEGRLVPTEAELAKTGNRKAGFETGEALLARILTERRQNWRGRGQYKEPAILDTIDLPRLPEGWAYCQMELLADVLDPQPSHRTPPEVPNGVPYIGIGDIRNDGTIDLPNSRKVPVEVFAEHQQRYQLRDGDFIVGKIGTVGKAFRLQQPFDYTLSANIVLIQPHSSSTYRGYIQILLESPESQKGFSKGSRATTQAAFGIQKFRQLPIALPPLTEQTRIVAEVERRLSVVEELESMVSANLQRATRLRQSILQRAFTGGLLKEDNKQ